MSERILMTAFVVVFLAVVSIALFLEGAAFEAYRADAAFYVALAAHDDAALPGARAAEKAALCASPLLNWLACAKGAGKNR